MSIVATRHCSAARAAVSSRPIEVLKAPALLQAANWLKEANLDRVRTRPLLPSDHGAQRFIRMGASEGAQLLSQSHCVSVEMGGYNSSKFKASKQFCLDAKQPSHTTIKSRRLQGILYVLVQQTQHRHPFPVHFRKCCSAACPAPRPPRASRSLLRGSRRPSRCVTRRCYSRTFEWVDVGGAGARSEPSSIFGGRGGQRVTWWMPRRRSARRRCSSRAGATTSPAWRTRRRASCSRSRMDQVKRTSRALSYT